jgi:hypothetical protein
VELNDVVSLQSAAGLQVGDYVRFSARFGRIHQHLEERFWKITEIKDNGDQLYIVNSSGHRDVVMVAPHNGIGVMVWNGSWNREGRQ